MLAKFLRNRFGQDRSTEPGQGGGAGRGGGGGRGAAGGRSGGGGRGQGRGNKPGSGPGGNCVCPKCGKIFPHVAGQRCIDQVCTECGIKLIRE